MTTMALIGAGPGLGAAAAGAFGARGFDVALIAGQGAFARMLHDVVRDDDIHVAQLIVPGAITAGHPTHDPDVLAATLWRMHTERSAFRVFAEPMNIES
jgi:NAD(P)-dependent dehydrogenase (short-subunit alcohol dehydrogenase family)